MKKIMYAVLGLLFLVGSCQKDDESLTPDALTLEQQIEEQFKSQIPSSDLSSDANLIVSELKRVTKDDCQDCEITFDLSSTTGGVMAQVTITDSSGNVVFSQAVATQTTYTFTINDCETYNVTTQLLTKGSATVRIQDGEIRYNIPVSATQQTHQNYSFVCPKVCNDCEIMLGLNTSTGGVMVQVTITDSSGNVVFSQAITGQTSYPFTINDCETYNVTTQLLTQGSASVRIEDGATTYSIPASQSQQTYQNYSFVCPSDEEITECTITLCANFLSGSANTVFLGIFVNGSFDQAFPISDGQCVTLNIDENNTYEIRHIAVGSTIDFAFSLNVQTQTNNIGYYMQGNFDTTGIIPSQFMQCIE